MGGTREAGLRTKEKLLASDPDYYRKLGRIGGKHKGKKGFAAFSAEKRREAGRKGGLATQRKYHETL